MSNKCRQRGLPFLYTVLIFSFSIPVYGNSVINGTDTTLPGATIVAATPEQEKSGVDLTAEDKSRGQMLYDNHCHVCHDSNAHVRAKRKAKSQDDIFYWVNRWSTHLDLKWNKDDKNQVVKYLNKTYYQFTK